MTRLLQIALRDYVAYVRTPGFWLSIILVPVGITVFGGSSALMARTTPIPTIAVADFTGGGYGAAVTKALEAPGHNERPIAHVVAPPGGPFASP
ncbi:MAG TPA: hypothetical protein VKT30_05455, partial [Caulobacteraceae bacterium]|nr:hypothetical protein [Caulobacteraceae bacterium]